METKGNDQSEAVVRSQEDLLANDGRRGIVCGHYRSIPAPRKGPPAPGARKDRAVIVLADGVEVYVEPIDTPGARRPREERQRFEGKRVCVSGTVHLIMPSRGQSLIAPCVAAVTRIAEDETTGDG